VWAKIFLILALHSSASFDAWSTNRLFNASPEGHRFGEMNPIFRPVAGSRKMYIAINLAMIPLDVWIVSGRKPRAARAVSLSLAGLQFGSTMRNRRMLDNAMRHYGRGYPEALPEPPIQSEETMIFTVEEPIRR